MENEVVKNIHRDHARFKDIVKGRIKKELSKYLTRGELIGKKGKDKVAIPVPQIELPRFVHSNKPMQGVGQGEGEVGDAVGQAQGSGQGGKQAGSTPADEHGLDVEFTIDELADILGEALGLPNIKPKGKKYIESTKVKYTGIHRIGPQSLRHFRRTYKNALKRSIISGIYDPDNPIVIPVKEDFRYRSWRKKKIPVSNAVIIYMMDVSGSMGDEQKELVRIEAFWLNTWLKRHYKHLEVRYITHDAEAREVDEDTFFHTKEAGGTLISTAYKLCAKIIESDYPVSEWNIYPFHFSDGDNWSGEDTKDAINTLKERILPVVNQFGYGQVESPYGSGRFIKDLREGLKDWENVVLSEIKDKDSILQSIKDFLGGGR